MDRIDAMDQIVPMTCRAIGSDSCPSNLWKQVGVNEFLAREKLDMYFAAGLLSQFKGPPLVSHRKQSVASSFSKAQQSSEDDNVVKDRVEVDEVSECSQDCN
ncbi:Transcription factor [Forsythia ovata]|uniref:Transcription factor n=1 Tax=Forsythia ovata TaxID=205694 RepID=A0ABD1WWI2_9LAMI